MIAALVVTGALALDLAVGEPPQRLHPVAWFGRCVGALDREYRRPRLAGTALAAGLPAVAAVVVAAVVSLAGAVDPLAAAGAGAVALFLATSLRRLLARAREVSRLAGTDLDAARSQLRALAGRDASALSPGQVRGAAVESLAENLADGLVGPLAGFALAVAIAGLAGAGPVVTVAAGCGAAAWVKAVNTLDSMLGYRDRALGWASARLDDAAMWLPARLTAALLATVALSPGALPAARTWRASVPSPNSGWPMGTLAAILDVRLEKPGAYVLNPGRPLPDADAAGAAVRTVGAAGLLAYALAGVVAWT